MQMVAIARYFQNFLARVSFWKRFFISSNEVGRLSFSCLGSSAVSGSFCIGNGIFCGFSSG
jgi:hypothetical protein